MKTPGNAVERGMGYTPYGGKQNVGSMLRQNDAEFLQQITS